MKKYFLITVTLIISLILIIMATGFEFQNLESLMKPPMVEGENREIQIAFENFAGKQYKLVTPLKGVHRSAYNFFDLNGDNDNEVIVFYSKDGETDIVRMNVLDRKTDGTWVSIADVETEYSDVQQVEFADLNGDKIKEIIVGWTVYQNEYAKTMNVYMLSKVKSIYVFEKVYNSTYYDFRTLDIDCDNKDDILKIDYSPNVSAMGYAASFIAYSDDVIQDISSIDLDLSFSSITSITSDLIKKENRRRIYFDGPKHESGLITDCIFYNTTKNCFEKEKTLYQPLSLLSTRISNINSKDVNSDGIIEIPKDREITLGKTVSKDGTRNCYSTEWIQIEEGKASTISYEFFNSVYGYSYKIDDEIFNKITVENDQINGKLTFYQVIYSGSGAVRGDPLFSIIATESPDDYENLDFRYKLLFERSNYSYFYRIYERGEDFGITKISIRKNMAFN